MRRIIFSRYFTCVSLLFLLLLVLVSVTNIETFLWLLDKFAIRSNIPDLSCSNSQCLKLSTDIPTEFSCDQKDIFILVLILSSPNNKQRRDSIRQTWATIVTHREKHIKTLFVLGKHKNSEFLSEESNKYNDLVLLSHVDTYSELTVKTALSLLWTEKYCPQTKYILKTDDDSYNRLDYLVDYLLDHSIQDPFVGGFCFTVHLNRNPKSKWYVPLSQYPDAYLPQYCSGAGYVLSFGALQRILSVIHTARFISLEDVFITGICREYSGIHHTHSIRWSQVSYNVTNFHSCGVSSHYIKPAQMEILWNQSKQQTHNSYCFSIFDYLNAYYCLIGIIFIVFMKKYKLRFP